MKDKNSRNTSRTNWEALEAMDDETIDYSDIPPLTEKFFENATLRIPASQSRQWVQLDPEVLEWFRSHSSEYKAEINSVLRQYIDSAS